MARGKELPTDADWQGKLMLVGGVMHDGACLAHQITSRVDLNITAPIHWFLPTCSKDHLGISDQDPSKIEVWCTNHVLKAID
eukprot:scaffold61444_cov19-Tisochrysis_lutea.AAC.1